jgi:hypothetical protein
MPSPSCRLRSIRAIASAGMALYRRAVSDEGQERQLNIHLDPENLAGVYSNFANVSFSDYEFTITFARIDHEVEEGDVPGVVVSRVNMAPRFMRELIDAMNDSWSKWSAREGIRNLPETER